MDLDKDELLITKHKRKLISYTKQVASGKLDKNFYNAYCELYELLCDYMNAYNELNEANLDLLETNQKLIEEKPIIKEYLERNLKLQEEIYKLGKENEVLLNDLYRDIIKEHIDKQKGKDIIDLDKCEKYLLNDITDMLE